MVREYVSELRVRTIQDHKNRLRKGAWIQSSPLHREVSGLFFIGEVMNVTGWLGGYNFQRAWASAVTACHAV
ncbi:MAG TPA: hypothetical protein EYQ50_16055 [Verrucomicrobiales bacterium]|nr:hypothetical protein [Verrucomicrobiales bacterium]